MSDPQGNPDREEDHPEEGDAVPADLVASPATDRVPADDAEGLAKFVTRLTPLEEQVGVHVINALQHPKTLAVLTTVTADGSGSQQVVSIPLDADRFEQVQKLLSAAKREKKRRVRCVGFHCHFEENDSEDGESGDPGSEAE